MIELEVCWGKKHQVSLPTPFFLAFSLLPCQLSKDFQGLSFAEDGNPMPAPFTYLLDRKKRNLLRFYNQTIKMRNSDKTDGALVHSGVI